MKRNLKLYSTSLLSPLQWTCVLLTFISGISNHTIAQTEPMYSQYMFNPLPLNPGYAGSQGNLIATSAFRKQWTGMEGSPSTQNFSAHSPIKNKNIALGILAQNDKIGVTTRTNLFAVYAYKIKFNNSSTLSLGIQAGMMRMASELNALTTKLPDDPANRTTKVIYFRPGVGTGAYWHAEKYYLGISVPDILEVKLNEQSNSIVQYRHLLLQGGYVFNLSYNLKTMPGFLLKSIKGNKTQIDLFNYFIINDVLWLGAAYRSSTSLNFIIKAKITNQLSLGYSYDTPISHFSSLAGSSHEFMLSYLFVFFKDNAFMPRYF